MASGIGKGGGVGHALTQNGIRQTCSDDTPRYRERFYPYIKIKDFDINGLGAQFDKLKPPDVESLRAIIGNCGKYPGRPFKIGLHAYNFRKGSIFYNSGITYRAFTRMRQYMEAAGLIRVYAYPSRRHEQSTIEGTMDLTEMISSGAKVIYKPDFFYILKSEKDSNGNRHPIPIKNPNHPKLRNIRIMMRRYYDMLEAHTFSCHVPQSVVNQVAQKHMETCKKGHIPMPPNPQYKYPVITFTDNIHTGGRMYRAFWIECKREYRRFTRVDGEACVEIDFSAMHPQLLYLRDGHPPQNDIYVFPKNEPCISGDVNRRDVAKILMLSMINATSTSTTEATRRNVVNAAKNSLMEKRRADIPYQDIKTILTDIEERNSPISKYFYSGAWRYCSTKEADLMRDIILTAMNHKMLVLPVHDALICKAKDLPKIHPIIRAKTPLTYDTKDYV